MQPSDRDALKRLPSPDELRQALSRRVREAGVLRRLLRVSEYAATELQDAEHADHDSDTHDTAQGDTMLTSPADPVAMKGASHA